MRAHRHRPSAHAAVRVTHEGILPGTNLCVDRFTGTMLTQFRSGGLHAPSMHTACDLVYFLTHAHADHTVGLTDSWAAGRIHMSHTTKVRDRMRQPQPLRDRCISSALTHSCALLIRVCTLCEVARRRY
jgi:ribonuclease BN (tRNA processing enzyme)